MHSIGYLDASYPGGPVDFSGVPAGSPYGRGYWRLDQWHGSCSCWQVPQPAFHRPLTS